MPTRIAVLTDLHLPDLEGTAQEAVLDWAIGVLRGAKPDAVLVAGDLTACGGAGAARRARGKLDASGLNVLMAPGNSDRGTFASWERVRPLLGLAGGFANHECSATVFDTSGRSIPEFDRLHLERFLGQAGDRPVLIATHCHPDALAKQDRAWLEKTCGRGGRNCFLVTGHKHKDEMGSLGKTPLRMIRGLDPDKATGGAPALVMFEMSGGEWTCDERVFEDGDPLAWGAAEREGLVALLGLSCMQNTLGCLDDASTEGVACVELRAKDALTVREPELADGVRRWRGSGGRCLSIHLPTLKWNRDEKELDGLDALRASADMTLRTGAEAMTLHVPRAPIGLMRPGGQMWNLFLEATLDALATPLAEGVTLGIENLRMKTEKIDDDKRGYGYLPEECLLWVRSLREASRGANIGFHLDVGHARNNRPFSRSVTLGVWYALTGREITGYHIHQVLPEKGGLVNHNPISSIYGPTISYSSFLWAWRTKQVRRAPMFLEVKKEGQGMANLLALRKFLGYSPG